MLSGLDDMPFHDRVSSIGGHQHAWTMCRMSDIHAPPQSVPWKATSGREAHSVAPDLGVADEDVVQLLAGGLPGVAADPRRQVALQPPDDLRTFRICSALIGSIDHMEGKREGVADVAREQLRRCAQATHPSPRSICRYGVSRLGSMAFPRQTREADAGSTRLVGAFEQANDRGRCLRHRQQARQGGMPRGAAGFQRRLLPPHNGCKLRGLHAVQLLQEHVHLRRMVTCARGFR